MLVVSVSPRAERAHEPTLRCGLAVETEIADGIHDILNQVIEQYQQYVIGNYTRYPVCLVRGEGSYVWDAEGNRYLDFFPGWGCDLLGHCPPRVVEAVQEQVGAAHPRAEHLVHRAAGPARQAL